MRRTPHGRGLGTQEPRTGVQKDPRWLRRFLPRQRAPPRRGRRQEWFYAPKTRTLFLYHNGTGSPGEANVTWLVPGLKQLVRVVGSQAQPVRNVSLLGLGLRDAAYTYLDDWGVPSGGPPAPHRPRSHASPPPPLYPFLHLHQPLRSRQATGRCTAAAPSSSRAPRPSMPSSAASLTSRPMHSSSPGTRAPPRSPTAAFETWARALWHYGDSRATRQARPPAGCRMAWASMATAVTSRAARSSRAISCATSG